MAHIRLLSLFHAIIEETVANLRIKLVDIHDSEPQQQRDEIAVQEWLCLLEACNGSRSLISDFECTCTSTHASLNLPCDFFRAIEQARSTFLMMSSLIRRLVYLRYMLRQPLLRSPHSSASSQLSSILLYCHSFLPPGILTFHNYE